MTSPPRKSPPAAATSPTYGTAGSGARTAAAQPGKKLAAGAPSSGNRKTKVASVPEKRGFKMPRPSLLPVTIFAAVLFLGVRVGDLWTALTTDTAVPLVSASIARQEVSGGLPGSDSATPLPITKPQTPAIAPTTRPAPIQVAEDPAPAPAGQGAAKPGSSPPSSETPAASPAAGSPTVEGQTPPATAAEVIQAITPDSIEAVLEELRTRRKEQDDRELELDQREAFLKVAEQRVEQKVAELEAVRGQIQGFLKQADSEQLAQLDSLVKIYETMKPKEAAPIFDAMDNDVLLKVIVRMKETKVAPIIAAMSVKRAEEVTRLLVDRKKLPSLPE